MIPLAHAEEIALYNASSEPTAYIDAKTMVETMVVVCFQVFPAFILLSGRVLLTLPIKFKEEPCAEGRTGPFGSLSS